MFLCKFGWNNFCMKSVIKRFHNEDRANKAPRMPPAAIFKKPPKWFACRQGVVYKKRNRCVWFILLPLPPPPHSFEDLNPPCQAKKTTPANLWSQCNSVASCCVCLAGMTKNICVTGPRLIHQFSLFRMATDSIAVFFMSVCLLFEKTQRGVFLWKLKINQINNQIDLFLGQKISLLRYSGTKKGLFGPSCHICGK